MKYTALTPKNKINKVNLGGKSVTIGEPVELTEDEAKLASEYFVLDPPVVNETLKAQEEATTTNNTKDVEPEEASPVQYKAQKSDGK